MALISLAKGAARAPSPSLLRRVRAQGYQLREHRTLSGASVRRLGLARRHYEPELDGADFGGLTAQERARLLGSALARAAGQRYQRSAADLDVVGANMLNAAGAVSRARLQARFPIRRTARLTEPDPVLIGDRRWIALLDQPRWPVDEPLFVVNPGVPALLLSLEGAQQRIQALWLEPAEGRQVPPCLPPDALGRKLLAMTSGAVDVLRALQLWFGVAPLQTGIGAAFAELGLDVEGVLAHHYLIHLGQRRVLADATCGLSPQDCASLIGQGRLAGADAGLADTQTLRRIDAAMAEADCITGEKGTRAVLATGSVAHNRATPDSDVDILVVTGSPAKARFESRERDGLLLELQRVSPTEVSALLGRREPSLKDLREGSRLGATVPLWDPRNLADSYRRRAAAMRVPADLVSRWLDRATATANWLIVSAYAPPDEQWEDLRVALDNLVMAVLTLHPVRYQKPKWVVADLEFMGEDVLAKLLLDAYGARRASRRTVHGVLESSRGFLDWVAANCGYPRYEEVLAMGYAPQIPEFSLTCRTLADGFGLVQAGDVRSAQYVARFAARLGATLAIERVLPSPPSASRGALLRMTHGDKAGEAYRAVAALPGVPPSRRMLRRLASAILAAHNGQADTGPASGAANPC